MFFMEKLTQLMTFQKKKVPIYETKFKGCSNNLRGTPNDQIQGVQDPYREAHNLKVT